MNKETKKMGYRMYILSLKQLSPIDKGCQAVHSSSEYAYKYHSDPEYINYIENYKEVVMLDVETHPKLNEILLELESNDINHSVYREPNLDNIITSICFIADEHVWDKNYFQSYQGYYDYFMEFYNTDLQMSDSAPTYEEWLEHIGGEKNEKLIGIISGKKLS